nr:MAG TPA: hypothetical protein [Caudoviricetes sp.]DAW52289.1 MAG TPA: hypothetical protein [Caudoviricetes sp.]
MSLPYFIQFECYLLCITGYHQYHFKVVVIERNFIFQFILLVKVINNLSAFVLYLRAFIC